MQYTKRLTRWFFSVGAASLVCSALISLTSGTSQDLTDDFSFHILGSISQGHTPTLAKSQILTLEQVTRIFKDRLDRYPAAESAKVAQAFLDACNTYHFDPAFILSVIEAESRFRVGVVSSAGAVGLMQLMPATARVISSRAGIRYTGERALRDPATNIRIGVAYLSILREKYRNSSPYFMVAAYNMGPAKLDELRARPGFKPSQTMEYFGKIIKKVSGFRYYTGPVATRT